MAAFTTLFYTSKRYASRLVHQQLRVFLSSPGTIMDKHVPIPKEARHPIYSRLGLRERYTNVRGWIISTFNVGYVKRKFDWKPASFLQEAQEKFLATNKAFIVGDLKKLRELVTDKILTEFKKEITTRGNNTKAWKIDSFVEHPSIVNVRYIAVPGETAGFAQVTVRMNYIQKLVHAGKETEQSRKLVEYLVFEAFANKKEWRICGKLVPEWLK